MEVKRTPSCQEEETRGSDQVHTLEPVDSQANRRGLLLEQLNLQIHHLTPLKKIQLEAHNLSFSDVFALESSKLGTTTLTQHSNDTGAMLKATLDTVMKDMLSQGVIVPALW